MLCFWLLLPNWAFEGNNWIGLVIGNSQAPKLKQYLMQLHSHTKSNLTCLLLPFSHSVYHVIENNILTLVNLHQLPEIQCFWENQQIDTLTEKNSSRSRHPYWKELQCSFIMFLILISIWNLWLFPHQYMQYWSKRPLNASPCNIYLHAINCSFSIHKNTIKNLDME